MSVLSVAPMMQWTDSHWRHLMRNISSHSLLYTEMIMADALVHSSRPIQDFFGPHDEKGPVAVQLGGSDPELLAQSATICQSKLIMYITA